MRNIIIYVLIKNLYALICNEFAYREEEEKMTLKDCYMQMGADYEETVQRLRSESLIQRIILKFPQDPSYQELCQALADGNIEVAFRAAHTLKGVCQNLGFKNLYEPSAELTERLRPLQETETDDLMQKVTEVLRGRETAGSDALYAQVKEQYTTLTDAIRELAGN